MKILYIVRHAKSSWDDISVDDHDRDITNTGMERTIKVARFLMNKKISPDLIISSSAVRALKTAKLIAENIGYSIENIKVAPLLYGGDEDDIFSELYKIPDNIHSVMIVGHNPGFTDFANIFLKRKNQIENLPTSGVIAIKIKTEHWKTIDNVRYKFLFKAFPREIRL